MSRGIKIKVKIILPIVLAAAIVLSAASIYSYYFTVEIIREEVINHLETTAQAMKRHIEGILLEQKEKILIAATHDELSEEELQQIADISPEYYEVFVIDADGIIIISTDNSRVGHDKSKDAYFINAREKAYIKPSYFSENTQKNAIAISAPHAGGVLVARIELEYFDEIMADRTGLGQTGESLLAYRDENGTPVFFTTRRFAEEETLEQEEEHNVLPIEEALSQNEDIFFEHDYRHVPVIAATRYIGEVDMGLVVKIDQAEAMMAANDVLKFSIIRIVIVLFIFFMITYLIARYISRPIIELSKGAEIIGKGNLKHNIEVKSKDEIGQLAADFNQMTDKLAKTRANIEKQIAERTADLENLNRFMTGREIKMIELKKEIKELKDKLKIANKE